MLSKVLISCALFVAAQAHYVSSGHGAQHGSSLAGIAVQLQPAATLTALPTPGGGCGAAPAAYGAAPASYGASNGAHGISSIVIPGRRLSGTNGVDAEALRLANLVWSLPSAGGPSGALINVPQFHTTSYSAPGVVIASGNPGNAVSGASAAAAIANVKSASSGYGPAPAITSSVGSGYGPASSAY